jgi:hypothetical protein
MVVVELGEPGVPVVCICALAEGATATTTAASIPQRRIRFIDFIGADCWFSDSREEVQFAALSVNCL